MGFGKLPHTSIRKARIQEILDLCSRDDLDLEMFIAKCSLRDGTSRRTIMDYVNVLVVLKKVEVVEEEGKKWVVKK